MCGATHQAKTEPAEELALGQMDGQQQQPNRASTSNEPLRTDAAITYQRIESRFAAWVKAVPKARRPSLSIPQLCTCRHEPSRALREQIVLPMLLMFSVVGAITVTGSSDSTTNLILGTDIASGVDPTYTSTTPSIDSFAKGPADASICNLGTTHIARSDGSVTCNAAAEKNLRCPLELLNGDTQPENTADGCGLLGDGDSAVSPNISCVFSPRFESAAATARTCHDYTHLDIDEPQRHSSLRALGPPIGAAAGSLCGGDLIRSSAAAARTSLPEQQPFTTVVSLSNASANDSLIMDASSCGSGSTILGFALRAAAELNTFGLPPSAFISTNISASTNIISGEDGTHASAVVSTNVTGSTDVIFGEIVALHVVPIVYLILVTQARSTQLP